MEQIYNYLITTLNSNQFFGGGVLLASLSFIGYKLSGLATQLWNKIKVLTVFTVYIDDKNSGICEHFSMWYEHNYPQKFRSIEIKDSIEFDSLKREYQGSYKIKQYLDTNVIWYQGRLLYIQKGREKFESSTSVENLFLNNYNIRGFLAKKQILNLIEEVKSFNINALNQKKKDDIFLYTQSHNNEFWTVSYNPIKPKEFKNIFFKDKEFLINDLNKFEANSRRYNDLGIKYKRSLLLYGPAGTGKTTIVSACAKHLGYNLYYLNLSSIEKNKELQTLSREIKPKSVVVIEDIDCNITGRNSDDKVDMSNLLNFLDGSMSPSNCVIIMTTNHIEKLDPALIRSGRADLKIEVGYATKIDVENYLSMFYNEEVKLSHYDQQLPMVDIEHLCLRNDNCNDVINILSEKVKTVGK